MNKFEFILAILTLIFSYILNGLSLVIVIEEGKMSFIIKYIGKNLKLNVCPVEGDFHGV